MGTCQTSELSACSSLVLEVSRENEATKRPGLTSQYDKIPSLRSPEKEIIIFFQSSFEQFTGQHEHEKTTTVLQPKDAIYANLAIFTT